VGKQVTCASMASTTNLEVKVITRRDLDKIHHKLDRMWYCLYYSPIQLVLLLWVTPTTGNSRREMKRCTWAPSVFFCYI